MKHLQLRRAENIVHPCAGVLFDLGAGQAVCRTLELPWRSNAREVSCIPAGSYTVAPHVSPSMGACLRVDDTDPRTHILVHAGNTRHDTRGCILVGMKHGQLLIDGTPEDAVLMSRIALRRLLRMVTGPARLDIVAP